MGRIGIYSHVMSGESERIGGSVAVPSDVVDWLDQRAARVGIEREELVYQLLATSRLTDELDGADEDGSPSRSEWYGEIVTRIVEEAFEIERDAIEPTLIDGVHDLRARIIQVKRDVDTKAALEHRHESVEARRSSLQDDVNQLSAAVANTDRELDHLEVSVDEGFKSSEAALSAVVERVDELGDRCTKLTPVVRKASETMDRLRSREDQLDRAADIARIANVHGCKKASCGRCTMIVDLTLLWTDTCPQCNAPFSTLEPKRWLFGSARLRTIDRPELESGEE